MKHSIIMRLRRFSLMELLLVVIILSVMMGVSAPKLSGFYQGVQLQSAARQLAAFINLAREKRISSGRGARIVIDETWRKLHIEVREEDKRFFDAEGSKYRFELPANIDISEIKKNGRSFSKNKITIIDIPPLMSLDEYDFKLEQAGGDHTRVLVDAGTFRAHEDGE